MSKTFSARLTHAFLSLLLSAGLVFPLLGILEPSFLVPSVLLPVAAAVVLFELAALKRVTAVIAAVAGAAALVFWLVALDGLTAVSDVARAVSLRVAGVRSARLRLSDSLGAAGAGRTPAASDDRSFPRDAASPRGPLGASAGARGLLADRRRRSG